MLQENMARIKPATWETIHAQLLQWARKNELEDTSKVRVDSTAVPTPIQWPSDSRLLYDSIRVITRLLKQLNRCVPVSFSNHGRRAKRRMLAIANSRGMEKKKKLYRDLLKMAHQTLSYARRALERIELGGNGSLRKILEQLHHYSALLERVIRRTERRVLQGESVPAEEKVVSIFEEHTDIIRKGSREDVFGHKVVLTCGRSSLILDCQVLRGNPPDQTQVEPVLTRHQARYGCFPKQVSFDGGFATKSNLQWAKQQGIQDVAFARNSGLKIADMVRSSWIYKQLRRFRAGIEGCISTLKRVFGMRRCLWQGWKHFQQYVQLSIVSFNLVVLARLLLRSA